PAIGIHFYLASFKSWNGQWRDAENRAYVVLAAWRHDLVAPGPVKVAGFYRPESVWVTADRMDRRGEGLEIARESPPSADAEAVLFDRVIAESPTSSVKGIHLPELDRSSELSEAP